MRTTPEYPLLSPAQERVTLAEMGEVGQKANGGIVMSREQSSLYNPASSFATDMRNGSVQDT